MKDRDEDLRVDDERTFVVLSNRLAKIHNLPVWTVCAAQQAIESKMGVKNIIADDRLKLVKLLEEDKDYYSIVLARVREIKDPTAISNYYAHYKKGFTWPTAIGENGIRSFLSVPQTGAGSSPCSPPTTDHDAVGDPLHAPDTEAPDQGEGTRADPALGVVR